MPYTTQAQLPWAPLSETSYDAAVKAESFSLKQEARALRWFQDQGATGGTQRECSEQTGIPRMSVAARVNALWKGGKLVLTGERRSGCAVYRA